MAKKTTTRKTGGVRKHAKRSARKAPVTARVKGKTVNIYVTKIGLKQGIRAAIHSTEE